MLKFSILELSWKGCIEQKMCAMYSFSSHVLYNMISLHLVCKENNHAC